MSDQKHIWELEGVGTAPFTCKGVAEIPSKSLAEANPSAYNYAMSLVPVGYGCGTCGVCGTSLKVNFLVEDATGRKFAVGSTCITKAGGRGLVETMKYYKNKRNREKAQERREQQRLENLQAQRDRNGGLTDYEVKEQQFQVEEEKKKEQMIPVIELLEELSKGMQDNRGGFRDSIAKDLEQGKVPYGRGLALTCEILAKQWGGRKGSQAYQEAYEGVSATLYTAQKMTDNITT